MKATISAFAAAVLLVLAIGVGNAYADGTNAIAQTPATPTAAPPAGQDNSAQNLQGTIVAGAQNVQTGLNNNTVQASAPPRSPRSTMR